MKTASNTYQQMGKGTMAGSAQAPMHTSGGRHPGVPRVSKHPMKSMTSRKGQQANGSC